MPQQQIEFIKIIPWASLLVVAGLVWKFWSYAQSQAKKESNIDNKICNLEKELESNINELKEMKAKVDDETKQILDKLDKNSEKQDKKIEEIKNLILEIFRDK